MRCSSTPALPLLSLKLLPAVDPMAISAGAEGWTLLPLAPHPGAFGVVRKNHVHEGVDIYCPDGTEIRAIEDGFVSWLGPFTGPGAGSPWWLDTQAVMLEGKSGALLYGEIIIASGLFVGKEVSRGEVVGRVTRVLQIDKGRPLSMLHFELHEHGTLEPPEWTLDGGRPGSLRDPTLLLMSLAVQGWDDRGTSVFIKAGGSLVPIGEVVEVDISNLMQDSVRVMTRSGVCHEAIGFDAIEAVMLLKPSAMEGLRMNWRKGAWAFHNIIAHPAMQVFAWFGCGRLAVRLHDATTPRPR